MALKDMKSDLSKFRVPKKTPLESKERTDIKKNQNQTPLSSMIESAPKIPRSQTTTNKEGVKFSDLNMRYSGSAALDLAYVASGRYDGYFHNKINIWDVAAGALMVSEAGGVVNDINKFNTRNIDIRASSSAINDKMLKNLKNF